MFAQKRAPKATVTVSDFFNRPPSNQRKQHDGLLLCSLGFKFVLAPAGSPSGYDFEYRERDQTVAQAGVEPS